MTSFGQPGTMERRRRMHTLVGEIFKGEVYVSRDYGHTDARGADSRWAE